MYIHLKLGLIRFQICKIKCESDTSLTYADKERATNYKDPDLGTILRWIGTEEHIFPYRHKKKKNTYMEDKLNVSLLLLEGSRKVCIGKSIQYVVV